MRKITVIFLIICMLAPAIGFQAAMTPVNRTASPDRPAEFELEVSNDAAKDKIFNIKTGSYPSWIFIDSSRKVEAGQNETLQVLINPPNDTLQQNYFFKIYVIDGKESREFSDYFTFDREFDLSLRSMTVDKKEVRPGEEIKFTAEVLNTAKRKITDYGLHSSFEDNTFREEGVALDAGSTGKIELKVIVPGNQPPGEIEVPLTLYRKDVEREYTRSVEVQRIRDISRSDKVDDRIVSREKTITAKNSGNYREDLTINDSLPGYLAPITSFSPEPDRRKTSGDRTTFYWDKELEAGGETAVSYTVRYWIPAAILVFLASGIIGIKRLRKDINFSKTAINRDGKIKIRLEIENHSGRSMKGVKVKDFVPDIASVEDKFPMAKPVIRKTSDGTKLIWEMDELEPGDQIVLEYFVNPLFKVEEDVELPEAEIEVDKHRIGTTDRVSARFDTGET